MFRKVLALMLLIGCAFAAFIGCAKQNGGRAPSNEAPKPVAGALGQVVVGFDFARVKSHGTNQFAVWIEDGDGNYVATLAATKFTAKGGYARRPSSIPEWVKKSGLAAMDKAEVDAISSATPQDGYVEYTWNCADKDGQAVLPGEYRFVVEGTADYTNDVGANVLFAGVIELGAQGHEAAAELERADEYAAQRNMITGVTAIFLPSGT